MAARKQLWHSDEVRARIRSSQLLNRLQDNALSKTPLMDNGQIQSAKILLGKVLPDLKETTVQGPGPDGKFIVEIIKFGGTA